MPDAINELEIEHVDAQDAPVIAYRFVDRAVEVTDAIEGVVEGYVYIFGDPQHTDSYGTWFSREHPVELNIDNGGHRRPLMYEHCQDPVIGTATIGFIEDVWFDDIGLRFRGALNRSSPHFSRIVSELRQGVLKTSSSTGEHTAKFREDKSFSDWTLLELSFTRYAAEPNMPEVTLIRSDALGDAEAARVEGTGQVNTNHSDLSQQEGVKPMSNTLGTVRTMSPELMSSLQAWMTANNVPMSDLTEFVQQAAPAEGEAPPAAMSNPAAAPAPAAVPPLSDPNGRSRNDGLLAQFAAFVEQRQKATELETLRAENVRLKAEEATRRAAPPVQPDPFVRGAHTPAPQITGMMDLRTARRSTRELMLAHMLMTQHGVAPSEEFVRAAAHRLHEDAEKGNIPTPEVSMFVRSRRPDGLISNMRANELMATTIAGQGYEWTTVAYEDFLWGKVRTNTVYQELMNRGALQKEVPAGADSVDIYTSDTDMTWYSAPQATDLDATGRPSVTAKVTPVGTGKINVVPGEIAASGTWSYRLDESSIINIADEVNRNLEVTYNETVEYILINGDTVTTASTNINLIDGTPATGISSPSYLNSNGALKNALGTSGRYYDGNAALATSHYLAVKKLLSTNVRSQDPRKFLYIVDVQTYEATLDLVEAKTRSEHMSPTLETGVVPPRYGVAVVQSGQMGLANTAGKISVTAGNNTKGRILLTFPEYWALIFKRALTIEVERDIQAGANIVVARSRFAVQRRSTDASAVYYNLSV